MEEMKINISDNLADQRALIARYDLVDVTRCGESWREMQRDDQYGDWVSYEDHIAALADAERGVKMVEPYDSAVGISSDVVVKLLTRQHRALVRMIIRLRNKEVERQFTECPRCYRTACDDILAALAKQGGGKK